MELMPLDKQILNILLKDARISYRQIGKKLGISTATVIKHVAALEKSGMIKRYTADLDYVKLGYQFPVVILLQLAKNHVFNKEVFLSNDSIFCMYELTGDHDVALLCMFRSREELDSFLKDLKGYDFIERTQTKIILNILKERWTEVA